MKLFGWRIIVPLAIGLFGSPFLDYMNGVMKVFFILLILGTTMWAGIKDAQDDMEETI